ncbi:hypothetical protein ALP10_200251 [Pseudomonas syringae pv. helianthi]|uniref:Uncharacterized protein n=2 Tax=Pseudomonas syringae group genomosp. 7 TaxID=251699 RepID=A0A3M4RK49_9PSED|nr:hypothetical protein ALO44_200037 [Pseudomonas syringae pv. tagetis]RMR03085.1 hypothetical protein ALP93_200402 [Pseudomonas syringae pv. helianthi]RMV48140.1 hypothetical protein ALP10_200251 [Pseudomonas syringae pv. helianthi]RMW18921.1 hypothetical protein ALO98_200369 [Pseudomonas syringae pv. tagetis]RMW26039.1 hypothetical protein ALO97_200065 [Pseudomonas syringae pv. tagetis]
MCSSAVAAGFAGLAEGAPAIGAGSITVLFAQAQDPQVGVEAVPRMDSAFKDIGYDASGVGPGLLDLEDQSLRCPLSVFAAAFGHMRGLSGVGAFMHRRHMAGHALVGVEALDGLRGQAYFELMRHYWYGTESKWPSTSTW